MKFNDNFRKTHNQFVGILHAINIYPKIAKMIKTFEVLPAQTKPPREVEVPNEIWLKFMNYLPTKDIFGTFALLNKRLNGLTLNSKYLSFDGNLDSDSIKLDQAIHVLKHSTGLVGLTIKQSRMWKVIVQEVLNLDLTSLKSLNIVSPEGFYCTFPECESKNYYACVHEFDYHYYNGTEFPIEWIQALNESKKIKLDTLILKDFIVKPNTINEIGKMESLKTLNIIPPRKFKFFPMGKLIFGLIAPLFIGTYARSTKGNLIHIACFLSLYPYMFLLLDKIYHK